MPREVNNLGLGATPLGNVFMRRQPAAFRHWLPGDQDETPIREFVNPP
jgi:hypothetical protein